MEQWRTDFGIISNTSATKVVLLGAEVVAMLPVGFLCKIFEFGMSGDAFLSNFPEMHSLNIMLNTN